MHLQQWLKVNTRMHLTSSLLLYDVNSAPSNVITILEKLLPAQTKSYELGLKLNLPDFVVKGIHDTYSDPQTHLLHVLMEFWNQVEPKDTWRVIVDALRSPVIRLPQLASELEVAYIPQPVQTKVPNTFGRNLLPPSLPPFLPPSLSW